LGTFIARSPNDEEGHTFQVVHGHPVFAYSYRNTIMPEGSTPRKKSPISGKVKLGKMAAIKAAFERVPVANDDPNWNCQNWTRDAIRALEERGYVPKGTAEKCDDLLAAADDISPR
jgi:hypothetical protein